MVSDLCTWFTCCIIGFANAFHFTFTLSIHRLDCDMSGTLGFKEAHDGLRKLLDIYLSQVDFAYASKRVMILSCPRADACLLCACCKKLDQTRTEAGEAQHEMRG